MNELVSIIIPCYNQAQYLPDALNSVLAQTYPYWECVVVNDASPDDTAALAKNYGEKDARIRVLNLNKNGGLANARNIGIESAYGTFILPLDADDFLAPEFLQASMIPFQRNRALKVVYTDAIYFEAVNKTIERPDFSIESLSIENVFQPCALFKKADFEMTEGYREELFGYEDWDFWIQLIEDDSEVFHIKQPLFYYRVKNESMLLALQGNPKLESEVRERIYAGNKKKVQRWNPALAYYYEKFRNPGDWQFKLKYRVKNLLSGS
jgi:glycosyltransferase involved in cell wall biosynthesis